MQMQHALTEPLLKLRMQSKELLSRIAQLIEVKAA